MYTEFPDYMRYATFDATIIGEHALAVGFAYTNVPALRDDAEVSKWSSIMMEVYSSIQSVVVQKSPEGVVFVVTKKMGM